MTQDKREAETLFTLVEARIGDCLTHNELEEVMKGLDAILDAAREMRAFKLENGDEPHQFFKPSGEPE